MLYETKILRHVADLKEEIRDLYALSDALRRGRTAEIVIEAKHGDDCNVVRNILTLRGEGPSVQLEYTAYITGSEQEADRDLLRARNLLPVLDEYGLQLVDGWPVKSDTLREGSVKEHVFFSLPVRRKKA